MATILTTIIAWQGHGERIVCQLYVEPTIYKFKDGLRTDYFIFVFEYSQLLMKEREAPPPSSYVCCHYPFSCIRQKSIAIHHKPFKTRLKKNSKILAYTTCNKFLLYWRKALVHLTFLSGETSVIEVPAHDKSNESLKSSHSLQPPSSEGIFTTQPTKAKRKRRKEKMKKQLSGNTSSSRWQSCLIDYSPLGPPNAC